MRFVVTRNGAPVDGLSAALNYRQTAGGGERGTIQVAPGAAGSGVYVGKRAFSTVGDYTVEFEFPSGNVIVYKTLQFHVSAAH